MINNMPVSLGLGEANALRFEVEHSVVVLHKTIAEQPVFAAGFAHEVITGLRRSTSIHITRRHHQLAVLDKGALRPDDSLITELQVQILDLLKRLFITFLTLCESQIAFFLLLRSRQMAVNSALRLDHFGDGVHILCRNHSIAQTRVNDHIV